MASIESLKKVLLEQVQGCRLLLELLQKEKVFLLGLQMEGIETLTKQKDILVLKLRLLEEERERLVGTFISNHFPGLLTDGSSLTKISLQKLADLTGEPFFHELRSKLISLFQSIKELNDLNKVMIDRTLGFLKKNNQFLGMSYPGASRGEKGRLLSMEM
jgi:flagellar biosynthesis/type III secretory pathway chaperone